MFERFKFARVLRCAFDCEVIGTLYQVTPDILQEIDPNCKYLDKLFSEEALEIISQVVEACGPAGREYYQFMPRASSRRLLDITNLPPGRIPFEFNMSVSALQQEILNWENKVSLDRKNKLYTQLFDLNASLFVEGMNYMRLIINNKAPMVREIFEDLGFDKLAA